MKKNKFLEILREALHNHYGVQPQDEKDIIEYVKQKIKKKNG